MPIPRSKIDEIREANSLVTILNEYGVELKHSGIRMTGLCPMHNERSPSFSVNPNTNTYKCFGCGEGGDVIALIQNLESLSFVGALEFLADKSGIVIERDEEEDETFKKRQVAYQILKDTAYWYRTQFNKLGNSHLAKIELQRRNLLDVHIENTQTNAKWLDFNGIGYAPDGWDTLCTYLRSKGYTDDNIVEAGLASKSNDTNRVTDRYRGRLTWEIRDFQGRIVGFGARKLFDTDNGPKYLNPPQTILYDKSRILYGLDGARKAMSKTRELYLVEGYTDVMTLRAVGINNVVAMSGTAFGEGHISLLRRVFDDVSSIKNNMGKLIFVFDGDFAGQKAAKRVFEMEGLPHERSYGVALKDGDPDDIRKEHNDEYLKELLTHYIPFTEYALNAEMNNHDLGTPEGRMNYVEKSLAIISYISSKILQDEYKRKIAFKAGVAVETIGNSRTRAKQNVDNNVYSDNLPPYIHHQRICLALLFQYPVESMVSILDHAITDEDFSGNFRDTFIEAINAITDSNGNIDTTKVLNHDDVSDEALGMDLLHAPLPIKSSDENITVAIDQSYKGLRKFSQKKENADISSQLAQLASDIDGADSNQIAMIEKLLADRKASKANRKKGAHKIIGNTPRVAKPIIENVAPIESVKEVTQEVTTPNSNPFETPYDYDPFEAPPLDPFEIVEPDDDYDPYYTPEEPSYVASNPIAQRKTLLESDPW